MNAIIVQARLSSTRLARKSLLPLLGRHITVIDAVLRRCQAAMVGRVILATPAEDIEFGPVVERNEVLWWKGDRDDVLGRYYDAARRYGASNIVRITGDCPLVSPSLLRDAIGKFESGRYDYLSNCHPTRTVPKGFDIEVFSFDALRHAHFSQHPYREHVTPIFYAGWPGNPFRIGTLEGTGIFTEDNLSIDTMADYTRVAHIFDTLRHDLFEWQDVRDYCQS